VAREFPESLEIDVVQVSEVNSVKKLKRSSTECGALGVMVGARKSMEGRVPDIRPLGCRESLRGLGRIVFPPAGTSLAEALKSIASSKC
jgi:hypothetical protein